MTATGFRRIALALEGAVEGAHFGHADFRVGNRIFASLGYPDRSHGMVGLTRASAMELGAHGITVNAVCPNHVTTALGAQQNAYFSRLLGFATVEDYIADMHRKNPMGRPGMAGDTAAACGNACQDAARTAAAACKAGGNPFRCLLDVARDFAACLRPCAEAAFTGGRACTADLHTCLEGCQGGSPSAAFAR